MGASAISEQDTTGGLYYEAGFAVIAVSSGLTPAPPSYDAGALLAGMNHHGNLC